MGIADGAVGSTEGISLGILEGSSEGRYVGLLDGIEG